MKDKGIFLIIKCQNKELGTEKWMMEGGSAIDKDERKYIRISMSSKFFDF